MPVWGPIRLGSVRGPGCVHCKISSRLFRHCDISSHSSWGDIWLPEVTWHGNPGFYSWLQRTVFSLSLWPVEFDIFNALNKSPVLEYVAYGHPWVFTWYKFSFLVSFFFFTVEFFRSAISIRYIWTLIPVNIGRSLYSCINAKLHHVLYTAEHYRTDHFS